MMTAHSVVQIKPTVPSNLPTYDAKDLTQNSDQTQIVLGEQTYTLRMTRAGKLILTK